MIALTLLPRPDRLPHYTPMCLFMGDVYAIYHEVQIRTRPLGGLRPMPPQNAFYAQSGGVTAVINASAAGVIETARQHTAQIDRVYAGRHGILGALTEELIDTSQESAATIAQLTHTPGGAFGSADR